jgi:hypothetical protein
MENKMVQIERYAVLKSMHLGPLRRHLSSGSILEWEPIGQTLKIDGNRIDEKGGASPAEGMRMLRALSERNPDDPPIEVIGMVSDTIGVAEGLTTSTLCVLPILGCIVEAERFLEENRGVPSELSPSTDKQQEFLEMFEDLRHEMTNIPELESRANDSSKPINQWFKERGFDIELNEPMPRGFAVGSILNVLLEWLYEGVRTHINGQDGKEYVGAKVAKGVTVSHLPALHPHPVARVATKSGDTVCMSMVDSVPAGVSGLFLKVADLDKVRAGSHHYSGVVFPMIDLDVKPDISWIQGMHISEDYFIEQAKQQTKFRMNHKGARVQSAAGMTVRYKSAGFEKPYTIDRPFLLWVQRDGFDFPLFSALLCEDAWKEPNEL